MTHQEYVDQIKSAALTIGVRAVMAAFALNLPWTQSPVVKQILEYIVTYILRLAILQTEFGAFWAYVDLRTTNQKTAFDEAVFMLQALKDKNASAEEIKNAEDKVVQAFRKFVSFTN